VDHLNCHTRRKIIRLHDLIDLHPVGVEQIFGIFGFRGKTVIDFDLFFLVDPRNIGHAAGINDLGHILKVVHRPLVVADLQGAQIIDGLVGFLLFPGPLFFQDNIILVGALLEGDTGAEFPAEGGQFPGDIA